MSEAPERSAVSELLARVDRLPSIPAVALEIVRLTEDENCTLDEFAAVLSRDPALSGKVLQMANSSLFNLSSPVTTLQRATMVLGMRTVKLTSLTFSLAASLPSEGDGPFDLREYWRRSIVCAVAARCLAARISSPLLDEAFLCGLLSRIGQLIVGYCAPDTYAPVIESAGEEWPGVEHERPLLGCVYPEIGAEVLRSWSLPPLVCDAIAHATDPNQAPPDLAPEAVQLMRILHAAWLCEELVCGSERTESLRQLVTAAHEYHQMEFEELEEVFAQLKSSIGETALMLEVKMDPVETEQIVTAARELFVDESLGIATEAHLARQYAARLELRNRLLHDQANTDALTELPNRACFDDALERCVADRRVGWDAGALGLLIVDVDRFKSFNDNYGHRTGDAVLKMIAQAIRGAMRQDELAARYGGEEFAAILPNVSLDGLASAAERIREAVAAARLEQGGATLSVTVSVGGACATRLETPQSVEALIETADRCLYEAKRAGRNRCVVTPSSAEPGA